MGKPDWLSFRATRRVLGLAMLRQTFWASAGVASSRSAMCSFLLSLTGFDVRGGGTPMENAPAAAITALLISFPVEPAHRSLHGSVQCAVAGTPMEDPLRAIAESGIGQEGRQPLLVVESAPPLLTQPLAV
jgi:hypothetical protein